MFKIIQVLLTKIAYFSTNRVPTCPLKFQQNSLKLLDLYRLDSVEEGGEENKNKNIIIIMSHVSLTKMWVSIGEFSLVIITISSYTL
jgi:hypothetical protein